VVESVAGRIDADSSLSGKAFLNAPSSGPSGHPLPAGERRFFNDHAKLDFGEALTFPISSPRRGEVGRAKRRPDEGAFPSLDLFGFDTGQRR
jgi:hypothetical protein